MPDSFEAASSLYRQGDTSGAADRCRAILGGQPRNAAALNLLGVLTVGGGDARAGVELIRSAVSLEPANPEFLVNLGHALTAAGELTEAAERLTEATRLPAAPSQAFLALARVLTRQGNDGSALEVLWGGIQRDPEDQARWIQFAETLAIANFAHLQDPTPLLGVLLACFDREGVDHQSLVRTAGEILWHHPPLSELRPWLEADDRDAIRAAVDDGRALRALSEPALLAVLGRAVLPDPAWEKLLTQVRASVLDVAVRAEPPTHALFQDPSVVCSLARQCFLNGYAFFVTDDEERLAETLSSRLADGTLAGDAANVARVAALACYRPLLAWQEASPLLSLFEAHPHPAFFELLVQQVDEPLAELELSADIPTFGDVRGNVSAKVQAQYEEHPYPRWVSLNLHEPRSVVQVVGDLFPGAGVTGLSALTAPEVLVAGCGTGKNLALILTTFEGAKVTGVDLSRASLSYARRMLRRLGTEHVTLMQADILALEGWDQRFDVIDCSGVLHHMEDPAAGWSILTDLLRPGGLMKISLYSELARKDVVEARAHIVDMGYRGTDADIRRLRRDVLDQSSRWPQLLRWRDFYILEECRDLLFHVQEHRFTIPGIAEIVEGLGLDFLGFEIAESVLVGFRERFPDAGAERSPEAWHEWEIANPETFKSMYMFWLQKQAADHPSEST